ncbi:MAG: hypothetical protein LBJ94_02620 [Puniceicoccales bacterium]|jgi:hypothetical protein|nr:hypothetical protein [Puniceicoccales bacterium]
MRDTILYLIGSCAIFIVAYRLLRMRRKVVKIDEKTVSFLNLTIKNLRTARNNIGKNSSLAFIGLLTSAIETYLAAEFKYVDSAKTSDEILGKFVHDVTNDWTASSLITEIFSLADQVKFARRELSIQQQRGLYKKACRLILNVSRSKRRVSPCK